MSNESGISFLRLPQFDLIIFHFVKRIGNWLAINAFVVPYIVRIFINKVHN